MDDMSEEQTWVFGAQSLRFEPPDLVVFTLVGSPSGDEMSKLAEQLSRLIAERGHMYSLANLVKLGGLSAEARNQIRNFPLVRGGTAIFGASTQVGLIVGLLHKAYTMFFRGAGTPIAFFPTEAEAREWVEDRRKKKASAEASS
jgi:hypothetical protein